MDAPTPSRSTFSSHQEEDDHHHLITEWKEQLQVLRQQEQSCAFQTGDYLRDILAAFRDSCAGGKTAATTGILSAFWRETMAHWAYNLIDYYDYPREAVNTCLNFMDRYLRKLISEDTADYETPEAIMTKRRFQLLGLTCLYLAIKVDGPASRNGNGIGIETMVALSRNIFTPQDVEAMERDVLKALHWRVHLPTSYDFLRHYLRLLIPTIESNSIQRRQVFTRILDQARFSLELSVIDYYFVSHLPSQVALASLLRVLEKQDDDEEGHHHQTALSDVVWSFALPGEAQEIQKCLTRLKHLHASLAHQDGVDDGNDERVYSPTSVVVTVHQL